MLLQETPVLEQTIGPWVAPLLIIPGMALLTISTGNRFGQLQLHLLANPDSAGLKRQLSSLRRALAALYAGIAIDAAAAFAGGVLTMLLPDSGHAMRVMIVLATCAGMGLLVYAAVLLAIDARRTAPF